MIHRVFSVSSVSGLLRWKRKRQHGGIMKLLEVLEGNLCLGPPQPRFHAFSIPANTGMNQSGVLRLQQEGAGNPFSLAER